MRARAARGLIRAGAAAFLAAALVSCSRGVTGAADLVPLVVGNERIRVEVAATPLERQRGLMHRESLPEDQGMLFMFPEEKPLSFWMKDTPLPLSIAFADAGGRILRIADLEPLSRRAVGSGRPARYALEMNRGWFSRHGVFPGDRISGIPQREVR